MRAPDAGRDQGEATRHPITVLLSRADAGKLDEPGPLCVKVITPQRHMVLKCVHTLC